MRKFSQKNIIKTIACFALTTAAWTSVYTMEPETAQEEYPIIDDQKIKTALDEYAWLNKPSSTQNILNGSDPGWGKIHKLCEKQFLAHTTTRLKALIDFAYKKNERAISLFKQFKVGQYVGEPQNIKTLLDQELVGAENISLGHLNQKILPQWLARYNPLARSISLDTVLGTNTIPQMTSTDIIDLLQEFDTLAQELSALFSKFDNTGYGAKLYSLITWSENNGIGISAKIYAAQWKVRHQKLIATLNEYKEKNNLSDQGKWYIKDFFLFLLIPFVLSPYDLWD